MISLTNSLILAAILTMITKLHANHNKPALKIKNEIKTCIAVANIIKFAKARYSKNQEG